MNDKGFFAAGGENFHCELEPKKVKPGKNLYKVTTILTKVYLVRADSNKEAEDIINKSTDNPAIQPSYIEREVKTRKQR